MKVPNELMLELFMAIRHEELIRIRYRLGKRNGIALRQDVRDHLIAMLTAEIERRDRLGLTD